MRLQLRSLSHICFFFFSYRRVCVGVVVVSGLGVLFVILCYPVRRRFRGLDGVKIWKANIWFISA